MNISLGRLNTDMRIRLGSIYGTTQTGLTDQFMSWNQVEEAYTEVCYEAGLLPKLPIKLRCGRKAFEYFVMIGRPPGDFVADRGVDNEIEHGCVDKYCFKIDLPKEDK